MAQLGQRARQLPLLELARQLTLGGGFREPDEKEVRIALRAAIKRFHEDYDRYPSEAEKDWFRAELRRASVMGLEKTRLIRYARRISSRPLVLGRQEDMAA